jgi:hypothetical protein
VNDSFLVWLGVAALLVVLIVMATVFFDRLGSTRTPPSIIVPIR